jgi:hypothetical protein
MKIIRPFAQTSVIKNTNRSNNVPERCWLCQPQIARRVDFIAKFVRHFLTALSKTVPFSDKET